MKVNFTGNYLYTFKNTQIRNAVCEQMRNAAKDIVDPENKFNVYAIDDEKMILLNGQDYKDYVNALYAQQLVGIKGFEPKYAQTTALKAKSTRVDLSNMNIKPEYKRFVI